MISRSEHRLSILLRTEYDIEIEAFSLKAALTHRSVSVTGGEQDNEVLELLGDSILDLIVIEELITSFPSLKEGDISKIKCNTVNNRTLAAAARQIRLGDYLHVGENADSTEVLSSPRVLAGALEALIASIYLRCGLEDCRCFVKKILSLDSISLKNVGIKADYKTALKEHLEGKGGSIPRYQIVEKKGPQHAPKFTCVVTVGGESYMGEGSTRRSAEQAAAQCAFCDLGVE